MIRVVAGVVVRGSRVLAAQRGAGMHLAGLWELPGGKVEPGEDDAVALRRELAEELGLEVEVGRFLADNVHHYPTKTIRLVALAARSAVGEPRLAEHAAVRWLAAHELGDVEWAPADVPLLPTVVAHLATAPG